MLKNLVVQQATVG